MDMRILGDDRHTALKEKINSIFMKCFLSVSVKENKGQNMINAIY